MASSPSPSLEIVPLGGLGEVGMNCMTLEIEGSMVILDCGVTFPGGHLGVNLIHPSLDHIVARRKHVDAVLITHGHEDHIGAIPFLMRALGDDMPPICAPPYAIELIKRRVAEFGDLKQPEYRPTERGQCFVVGAFEVEPYRVNHSTPGSTGLILRTAAGVVVHSGDFKIEETPPPGEAFDADRLRRLADEEGVDLLMSDSTNVDNQGRSGNELDAAKALDTLVGEAKHRVIIALFASNVYRMRGAFEAAKKHHRKVLLLGRSVENHALVARQLGYIRGYDNLLVSPEQARRIPRDQLLVIATGTQGERPAALGRLSRGDHRYLDLAEGDTVVLSSRIIPGQEKSVFELIDALERRGVRVIDRKSNPRVHVSGHACKVEQAELIRMADPEAFVAVHGTYHMMRAHNAIAREEGVPSVLLAENGIKFELKHGELKVTGRVPTGRVHIAHKEEVDEQMLKDRALSSEIGTAVVAVAIRNGRLVGMPELETRGFLCEHAEAELCDEAADYVAADLRKDKELDPASAEDRARRAVKRFFGRRIGRKPLVVALAVDLP